ncbi:hypothetical protein PybrP1_007921 [[Pythium] brassicae (nom. inval.)]|nr:hypothetical protein PybrP1_007921 [[Pythium] brassicae (nom. inval.)]
MPADSLDAAFALLNDVRAQSFALELRLRNNLPRIARIDRELASLPPAQRFWHRRQHRREQQRAAQLKEQEAAERSSTKAKARAANAEAPDGNSVAPTEEEKENQPHASKPMTTLHTADDGANHLDWALHFSSNDDSESNKLLHSQREGLKPPAARTPFPQPSSSVGRQVLSEFRNAPSAALYGPPAVSGNPNAHDRRLNSDVLRRLFSDLDTDRDGHLNRIETCVALHRLQIAVPAPKIVAFFRHVHAQSGEPSTSKRGSDRGNASRAAQHMPLLEVISYKQFVAFVTAAYEQQSGRAQTEATKDWSGLRRAAAYFDKQPSATTADVDDCSPEPDASLEDPANWLGVLAEEQTTEKPQNPHVFWLRSALK